VAAEYNEAAAGIGAFVLALRHNRPSPSTFFARPAAIYPQRQTLYPLPSANTTTPPSTLVDTNSTYIPQLQTATTSSITTPSTSTTPQLDKTFRAPSPLPHYPQHTALFLSKTNTSPGPIHRRTQTQVATRSSCTSPTTSTSRTLCTPYYNTNSHTCKQQDFPRLQ
jgi:hypothetical protein